MATFKGPELIVRSVIAKLQENMPARAAAINAEFDDEVTISAPTAARYFTAAKRQIPPSGSAILVMDGRMTLDARGEGPHSLLTNTLVGVYVLDEHQDEETLASKLWRQSRAVVESLWDAPPQEQLFSYQGDGSQVAYQVIPMSTVPGRAFEPEGGGPSLRQFYLTTFRVTRLEQ